jgi:hypothetical protein
MEVNAEVVALMRLIPTPFDRNAGEMTEPQCADASMPDHGDVTRRAVEQQVLEGGRNLKRRVDRPLPAADTDRRFCEAGVRTGDVLVGGR